MWPARLVDLIRLDKKAFVKDEIEIFEEYRREV